jgi:DNA mismatch repair protein MutS
MRHPIVEQIIVEHEYVPVSIQLGCENQNGILLYGLNSVGKSTLQKCIGLNIILAQIGYYVPCKEFIFYPYKSLYTRITGTDNIFKGLSSFTLEILDLKSILKRSDHNTLIIADEVCKGTEYKSSLIIVMTMLEILSKKRCSFITATHLHDLIKFNRLESLLQKNIKIYHLHVDYDNKTKKFIIEKYLIRE